MKTDKRYIQSLRKSIRELLEVVEPCNAVEPTVGRSCCRPCDAKNRAIRVLKSNAGRVSLQPKSALATAVPDESLVSRRKDQPDKVMSERQIKKLLESTFWPTTLETSKQYVRVHDDHDGTYEGQITVAFDAQGDAWLWTDKHSFPPMRFRTWAGGGMSLRVRNALIILAEAIRLDNEEKPQCRPARKENER